MGGQAGGAALDWAGLGVYGSYPFRLVKSFENWHTHQAP